MKDRTRKFNGFRRLFLGGRRSLRMCCRGVCACLVMCPPNIAGAKRDGGGEGGALEDTMTIHGHRFNE